MNTQKTADEGREYKVQIDNRVREDTGGWGEEDEHVEGEGKEIFAVCG